LANTSSSWYAGRSGLWSDRPFLCLKEAFWDEAAQAGTTRYYVVDAESATVQQWSASYQAYSDLAYRAVLAGAGFTGVTLLDGLGGARPQEGMIAILAEKAGA
jgi:hypothetical protein